MKFDSVDRLFYRKTCFVVPLTLPFASVTMAKNCDLVMNVLVR